MTPCMRCANVSTLVDVPQNLSYPNLLNSKHHEASAEAHRSSCNEGRNMYCEYCGIGFSTPAESTDHAQTHRKHFCFVCGVEAHLPGRELPGQHCRVVGHDENPVKAKPKSTNPRMKIKKTLGHRPKLYNSPYSTQHRNIHAEKDVCIGDLLKLQGGLTVEQRGCVDIKAAGSGQTVDYLSDRDLLQLALAVRSRGA